MPTFTTKNVIVIATLPESLAVPGVIDPKSLVRDAINGIANPAIIGTRAIETASDDSTLDVDIKIAFADVLSEVDKFYVYDVADAVEYSVDFTLTPVVGG